jgi:hypothetical protein
MHAHYPLVGLRYVGAAILLFGLLAAMCVPAARRAGGRAREQQRADHARWLAAPPPPIQFPSRFTQNWIMENVPTLHPGQVPMLLAELRARGWTDGRIQRRITPYLNHHYGPAA